MICCDASIDSGEYSGPEFFKEEMRTARKEYRCSECGHRIKPGDRYEYVSGKWEGDFGYFRTCELCVAIRQEICSEGFLYGGLVEAISEADDMTLNLDKLRSIFKMRSKMAALVELAEQQQDEIRRLQKRVNALENQILACPTCELPADEEE